MKSPTKVATVAFEDNSLPAIDRAIIDLEIEKSKLNREKSMLVLNKALTIYFIFLFISILGYVNTYITKALFNVLILMGLCVLLIGIVPYIKTMQEEERNLNDMIYQLRVKKG